MYSGQQLVHLEKAMDEQFTQSNSRNLKQQLQFLNITKKITDTLCMTFKNGITVSAVNDNDQEIIDEIIDSTNLDAVMHEVDKKVFLTKQAFVKVNYCEDEDGGEIKLDIITPQYVEVTTPDNDPYEFDSILYPKVITDPSVTTPKGIFAFFDGTTFKLVDETGTVIPNEENPDNVNPYAPEIPLVIFRETLPSEGQFWLTMPEDLVMAQNSLNVKLTMLNQLLKLQSFGIPVLINPPPNSAGKIEISIDPSKPIIINDTKDQPGDFKFVSPDSKISELQDAIDKDIARIAQFYGLNPDDLMASGVRTNADSKNASNAGINEIREQRKLIFTPSLNELWDMIIHVWNVHNPLRQLSEDGVVIQINDPKRSYASIDDQIKENDWDLQNNLTTLAEILVEREDDLTYEEALTRIEENKIENNPPKSEGNPKSAIPINDNMITGSMPVMQDTGSMIQ
jgi:hypothetical protein